MDEEKKRRQEEQAAYQRELQARQERQATYLKALQEEERKRQEQEEKQLEELHRELEEQQRRQREAEERFRKLKEEERRRGEKEEAERLAQARQREEDFCRNMESGFEQQGQQVRDSEGNRWIKCKFCGKIAMESEFVTYGGPGRINLGTCKECKERLQSEKLTTQNPKRQVSKMNSGREVSNICPQCGGELIERNGRYGKFMGCRNYPDCRYSRKL